MSIVGQNLRDLKLLVVISSFGQNHLEFLKRIIRTYQSMSLQVKVVVVSEAPKDLGPDVEVVVGLPSKNPWSLPFAHKQILARNLDNYDLFAYSEDDIGVKEANIEAFLRATPEMEEDEIVGFLLYEESQSGEVYLPNFHGPFHWKVESIRQRGRYCVAEFSNEHAAFYLLTQSQLKRAIASGGFLREPYEGRHDMLCAAATDPYTCCGFRKVICISEPKDYLLHHLPNRYVGKVGIPMNEFSHQLQSLKHIHSGNHPATTLCEVETKMSRFGWSKSYYEKPEEALWQMAPDGAKTVLSVGCGWGATEVKLKQRGFEVTALPLDSVIGALAASYGIEVLYGTLQESFKKLGRRRFDCVFISNLLHLLPEPWKVLEACIGLMGDSGTLVIANPNFCRLPVLVKRLLGLGEYRKLRDFSQSGVHTYGRSAIVRQLKQLGCEVSGLRWFNRTPHLEESLSHSLGNNQPLGGLTAKDWVIQARRETSRHG